jgi:N-acyl-D-amino-acid deacylase
MNNDATNNARVLIQGGTVVDGTGGPGYRADVAITGDRITAIGVNLPAEGARVLDATGQIVAPGFIDIHTHYDAQVFWDQQLTPSCFHGVTTVIAGNCGFSIAPCRPKDRGLIARTLEKVEDMDVASLEAGIPWEFETFPEYLDTVRRRGVGLNFGAYVGHTAIRIYVMGDEAVGRDATEEEVASMRELVVEAMDAGAVGFATSMLPTHSGADGRPIPSRFAAQGELESLLEGLASTDRGVAQLTVGSQTMSMDDMYALQTRIGRPFTYTALLTHPSGSHLKLTEIHKRGRALGGDVWPQITPRPLVFQTTLIEPFTLNVAPSFAALMPASLDQKKEAYADAAWRARAVEELDASRVRPRWDSFRVGESATHPELINRSITELAAEQGLHPLDVMCALALEDNLTTRFKNTVANDDEEAVRVLLQVEGMTLGLSDAGAHVGQICDAPQATDLLGGWVRERSALTIEQAVRKLTGQQADIYGLRDRGYLREGAFADVAVFDPATVGPGPVRRVRDFPADAERLTADAPTGMTHVLVNGTPIRIDGQQLTLATMPGQVVTAS